MLLESQQRPPPKKAKRFNETHKLCKHNRFSWFISNASWTTAKLLQKQNASFQPQNKYYIWPITVKYPKKKKKANKKDKKKKKKKTKNGYQNCYKITILLQNYSPRSTINEQILKSVTT